MYRLMLVDDEYAVRKNVIDRINWNEYDFEIVCQAENGEEAYELFEQYVPDVVITDIKMPFMDGLELSEKILQKYPYTKIIILTGFDEFEYAKKSIDLHVMNYVLKPVSANSLIQILTEVKNKLDEEILQKRDVERLKAYYEKSYPLLRDMFLDDFIKGEYLSEEIYEWFNYYQITLDGPFYSVAVIQIDNLYNDLAITDAKDTEIKKMALLEFVEETNQRENLGICFLSNNQVVILISGNAPSELEFKKELDRKLEMIRQGIEKYQTYTITIGVGHTCKMLTELPSSRKSALNALDYKLMMGNNQIIYISDLEPNSAVTLKFSDSEARIIVRVLKSGATNEFYEYIDAAFNQIAINNDNSSENQLYLFELVSQMMITAKELKVDLSAIEHTEISLLLKLMVEDHPLEHVKHKITVLGEHIMQWGMKTRQVTTENLVSRAKAYIEQEFKDWDLSVQKICEKLNYSPNYFSTVFKKETGKSFMNYLMDRRLEEAKMLLLTTELKSLEIAFEVGFSSSNYFAYCFKKQLNISPMQYRKEHMNQ